MCGADNRHQAGPWWGKAVDGNGDPVTGFIFAEIGNIGGDANTDLFTLENGGANPGWYEYDGTNFVLVDTFTGAGYIAGTVGYQNDSDENTCVIIYKRWRRRNVGVQRFGEGSTPGTFEFLGDCTKLTQSPNLSQ